MIILILYVYECFSNGVYESLNNVMSDSEFSKYVKEMKESKIEIIYKVSAYHNKRTRTFTSRRKSFSSSTHKVNTYSEEFIMPIAQIADTT